MTSNVCYNLSKSEYYAEYKGYKFYFSSRFNDQRFKSKLIETIEKETLKLNAKYRTTINADIVIALYFYRLIEKRGFYVVDYKGFPVRKDYEFVMELL